MIVPVHFRRDPGCLHITVSDSNSIMAPGIGKDSLFSEIQWLIMCGDVAVDSPLEIMPVEEVLEERPGQGPRRVGHRRICVGTECTGDDPGTCNEKCTIITTRNRRADAFKPTCYLLIFTGELVS